MIPSRLDEPNPLEVDPRKRALLGTIELIITTLVVLVIVAFLVWFFFFAHDPLLR